MSTGAAKVPTETWRSSLTIPRELALVKEDGHFIVSSKPVKELQNILKDYKKEFSKIRETILVDKGLLIYQTKPLCVDLKSMLHFRFQHLQNTIRINKE
jgi:levanase/fructan beta-fructosidase